LSVYANARKKGRLSGKAGVLGDFEGEGAFVLPFTGCLFRSMMNSVVGDRSLAVRRHKPQETFATYSPGAHVSRKSRFDAGIPRTGGQHLKAGKRAPPYS